MATKKNNCRGFTLIEMVIALSIFALIAVSAYGSFRSGFVAYQRIEIGLGKEYELNMFIHHMNQELRNSFFYAPSPFEGETDRLIFPTRLIQYANLKSYEDLCEVSYKFSGQELKRTEHKLRKEFKSDNKDKEEVLFKCRTFKFQYAYKDKSGTIVWKSEWNKKPYVGIPRAIRIIMNSDLTGGQENHYDFFIPQGFLGTQS